MTHFNTKAPLPEPDPTVIFSIIYERANFNIMEEGQVEKVKLEDVNTTTASPTFKGKLKLSDYGFSPKLEITDGSAFSSAKPGRQLRKSSSILETPEVSSSNSKRKLSNLSSSSSPRKNARSAAGYAPPTTYAHLPELRDVLSPNLICVFIGLNPGITTASSGHAYAHHSNLFWKLLHSSGCTTRRCKPQEDGDLPRLFELGNTNIVSRPTRNGSELSKEEMDASVQVLEDKIAKYKPEAVCIVGKSIWESIWRVKHGKKIKKEEFKYGWQDEKENLGVVSDGEDWAGAKVFVGTTTSALAATMSLAEKEAIWRELGMWVEKRRVERAISKAV